MNNPGPNGTAFSITLNKDSFASFPPPIPVDVKRFIHIFKGKLFPVFYRQLSVKVLEPPKIIGDDYKYKMMYLYSDWKLFGISIWSDTLNKE